VPQIAVCSVGASVVGAHGDGGGAVVGGGAGVGGGADGQVTSPEPTNLTAPIDSIVASTTVHASK